MLNAMRQRQRREHLVARNSEYPGRDAHTIWISNVFLICLPAFVALLFKGGIYAYASCSSIHNRQTQLYLYFLFALSIQNVAEIFALYTVNTKNVIPYFEVTVFYASSIVIIALLFHLALSLAFDNYLQGKNAGYSSVGTSTPDFLRGCFYLPLGLSKITNVCPTGLVTALRAVPGPCSPCLRYMQSACSWFLSAS